MTAKDFTGQVFGSLTAISSTTNKNISGSLYWRFKCVCGNECEKVAAVVKKAAQLAQNSQTPSCGCMTSAIASATAKRTKTKHGLTNHPLYAVHNTIKSRCYNQKTKSYSDYGAKGVTMCDEWLKSPIAFIEWALANGWAHGKEVDKDIKVAGNKVYSPDTCLVVDKKTNLKQSHTRENAFGKSKHVILSPSQVQEVLQMYSSNAYSQYEIAKQFNITRSGIQRLVNLAGITRQKIPTNI